SAVVQRHGGLDIPWGRSLGLVEPAAAHRSRLAGTIAAWRQRMEHFVWDAIPKEVLSPTIARKIITGEKAMVAQVFIAKGGVVPLHHHESEQITYIMEGALKFELEGAEIVVGKGQVLRIPSNVPHREIGRASCRERV